MFSLLVQIISALDSQSKFQLLESDYFSAAAMLVSLGGTSTWRLHIGLCNRPRYKYLKKCSKFLSRNSHKIPKFLLNLV